MHSHSFSRMWIVHVWPSRDSQPPRVLIAIAHVFAAAHLRPSTSGLARIGQESTKDHVNPQNTSSAIVCTFLGPSVFLRPSAKWRPSPDARVSPQCAYVAIDRESVGSRPASSRLASSLTAWWTWVRRRHLVHAKPRRSGAETWVHGPARPCLGGLKVGLLRLQSLVSLSDFAVELRGLRVVRDDSGHGRHIGTQLRSRSGLYGVSPAPLVQGEFRGRPKCCVLPHPSCDALGQVDRFWIMDVGSKWGTFVKISQPTALNCGDWIRLGDAPCCLRRVCAERCVSRSHSHLHVVRQARLVASAGARRSGHGHDGHSLPACRLEHLRSRESCQLR